MRPAGSARSSTRSSRGTRRRNPAPELSDDQGAGHVWMHVALEVVGPRWQTRYLVRRGLDARHDVALEERVRLLSVRVDRHVVRDAVLLVVERQREGLAGRCGEAVAIEVE